MIVSTFRAFSLVARALAAMLETLVRIQYKRAIACILIFHCPVAKTGYNSTLIQLHPLVRIRSGQPPT